MKKLIIIFTMIFVAVVTAFAAVPDMELFAPTEYEYMTELKPDERSVFLKDNPDIVKKYERITSHCFDGREFDEVKIIQDKIRVFSENVNAETFNWILVPVTRKDMIKKAFNGVKWFPEYDYILGITKVVNGKNQLLFMRPTYYAQPLETKHFFHVDTYQIIRDKGQNKGIIHYQNYLTFWWTDSYPYRYTKCETVKGQPAGNVNAYYYLFGSMPEKLVLYENNGFMPDSSWTYIQISSTPFLWDLKKPLKYALQNAFDKNSKTSFVENTEDDLININFGCHLGSKLRIINGYAASQSLYEENNSIKTINLGEYVPIQIDGENFVTENYDFSFTCKPNTLDWQTFDIKQNTSLFQITEIYKGTKYSDTSLAELNYLAGETWLFGDEK